MDIAKKLLALQLEYAAGERDCWDEANAEQPMRSVDAVAADYATTLRQFIAAPA